MENIICKSQAMKATMEMVNRIAPTQATILLVGETGIGKNLIARCIHDLPTQRWPVCHHGRRHDE